RLARSHHGADARRARRSRSHRAGRVRDTHRGSHARGARPHPAPQLSPHRRGRRARYRRGRGARAPAPIYSLAMRHVIAIDQGTTGSTVLVLDEQLAVRGRGYQEFRQIYPTPGWVEHDPDDIWASVTAAL